MKKLMIVIGALMVSSISHAEWYHGIRATPGERVFWYHGSIGIEPRMNEVVIRESDGDPRIHGYYENSAVRNYAYKSERTNSNLSTGNIFYVKEADLPEDLQSMEYRGHTLFKEYKAVLKSINYGAGLPGFPDRIRYYRYAKSASGPIRERGWTEIPASAVPLASWKKSTYIDSNQHYAIVNEGDLPIEHQTEEFRTAEMLKEQEVALKGSVVFRDAIREEVERTRRHYRRIIIEIEKAHKEEIDTYKEMIVMLALRAGVPVPDLSDSEDDDQ